ncbi:hypothetical protein LPW33_04995 [Ectothiorhodospira variabilis]|uniref:hypothetical protein n=1 Tax=Ectothiorhodospira variabilis TaxID=505694 RepID=UPI001EFA2EDB|nr:hypothetical protein [Ectothiorhodospira variabilis]MCG5493462.1 hypothetical protein [Ectothiorhodospira variabilis]MCG5496808.1 hypothetical protein [Ectothiorhodospira variabilis]MCG5506421.1 hypothetical protein [Ectothiorhodospira variabilis]
MKVYTARNEQHANIRLALQDGALGRLRLPDVLVNHGDLIVERWIDGEPLSGLTLTDKAKAAELVHEALLSKSLTELPSGFLNDPGFCYLVDYLLERIGPWVHWDSVDDFVAEWKCRYSSLSPVIPARVCHPDLSEANIIREFESGDLYVVDNELLGVGRGWVLDYQNSFVHGYGFSELDHEVAVLTFIDYSWRLRHLSKALALGDFSRAKSILEPSVMK